MGHSEVVSPLVTFVSILLVANAFVYREAPQGAREVSGISLASMTSVGSLAFAGIALLPLLYLLWLIGADKPTDTQKLGNPNSILKIIIFCLVVSSYLLVVSIWLLAPVA
jgi:hypothetical protein